MTQPHPADIAVEIDVIRAWTTLERARTRVDPRDEPVALVLRESLLADRFLDALGVTLESPEGTPLSCGWVPRAQVKRALGRIAPLEALRLELLPLTDVRMWTVVHAAEECRVAEHGRRGLVALAAEAAILGVASHRCLDSRCSGEDDHTWDPREIRDEAGEVRDDTTCTRCGMPEDVYTDWSAEGF